MTDYHITIFYSKEDEGYIADIPDLKYCSAFGDSPDEALEELLNAKAAWLEVIQKRGKTMPLLRDRYDSLPDPEVVGP